MAKSKRTKPTPPVAIDKSELLARGAGESQAVPTPQGKLAKVEELAKADLLDAAALVAVINAPPEPARVKAFRAAHAGAFCPICGGVRTADICPIDGHRFEVTK